MDKKKAIIFDLDGVLVFTDRYHYLAWKTIGDEQDILFDEKINDLLRGVSRMESLEIVLRRADRSYTEEEKALLAEEKNNRYRELLKTMTPADVSDEVRATIKELRCRGYKLAIGSSSKNTKFILKQVQLTDCFDAISDGTNITRSKPDPEVFLKAAEYLHERPEACAVIEDAVSGIQAAKAAGMTAIGIGSAVDMTIADHMISSLGGLLTLFPE